MGSNNMDHSSKDNCLEEHLIKPTNGSDEAAGSSSAISALLTKLPMLNRYFYVHEKIGEGTFSNVYLASLRSLKYHKKFAIKHLIPTIHPRRIKNELDYLTQIGGKDNVVSCEITFRNADCVVFIMPYLEHNRFSSYVADMTVDETRLYMKNLFVALKRVHSFNVIHRDIKPSNFLYNRVTKEFLLVDFGLAQKVNEKEDIHKLKTMFPTTVVLKRKREDDDLENIEKPPMKRTALQTLSYTLINKQPSVGLRYSKQPLSAQQRKWQQAQQTVKRLPLITNSSNIIESSKTQHPQKPLQFQRLLPLNLAFESGASFVRVQNSQVQSGLFPKPTAPVRRKDCDCNGKPQVCSGCLLRKSCNAPRAGTPGFRPPEVLLKYLYQTTAVDMWAAGVIMLCIMSGCYPFFRSPDDVSALSELITVFGTSAVIGVAKKLGRNIICSEKRKPINLLMLCENFRQRKNLQKNKLHTESCPTKPTVCKECHNSESPEFGCLCETKTKLDLSNTYFPRCAFDLLSKLLDVDPNTRISAEQALQHQFLNS